MKVNEVYIKGLKIIEPSVFGDDRGSFFESYNRDQFIKAGITDSFIQDNQSKSKKGVLRGLHYQTGSFAQAKLVRVIKGAIVDIALDLRKDSETYGKYYSIELNDNNNLMFYIPVGFAHGFISLQDDTIFAYKCSSLYNKQSEAGIIWNDSTLAIDWGTIHPIISEKDALLPPFNPEIHQY
jgi:dTDP-4-dehydrorhamnose 3,5-epimerase